MEMFLQHHGIKGQRWGVRRTPEQLGHRSSLKEKKSSVGYRTLKYKSSRKRGVAYVTKYAALTAAATFIPGFSAIWNLNTVRQTYNYSFDSSDYLKIDGPIEKVSTLKKKESSTTAMNDMKKVNPRGLDHAKKGTVNNCANCTVAMEMRRRGYDVRARKSGSGSVLGDVLKVFKKSKITPVPTIRDSSESAANYAKRGYENLCRSIEKDGPGARGLVSVQWKRGGGHAIFYEVGKTGDVIFYDGQDKKVNDDYTFSMADPSRYSYIRMDNLKPTDDVCRFVVSVDGRNKGGDKK